MALGWSMSGSSAAPAATTVPASTSGPVRSSTPAPSARSPMVVGPSHGQPGRRPADRMVPAHHVVRPPHRARDLRSRSGKWAHRGLRRDDSSMRRARSGAFPARRSSRRLASRAGRARHRCGGSRTCSQWVLRGGSFGAAGRPISSEPSSASWVHSAPARQRRQGHSGGMGACGCSLTEVVISHWPHRYSTTRSASGTTRSGFSTVTERCGIVPVSVAAGIRTTPAGRRARGSR